VVVQRMVRDLHLPVEVVVCPIVRETDGLAMSSRNACLNAEERRAALVLYRALSGVRERLQQGERDSASIAAEMRRLIEQEPSARIDYAAVVDAETLAPVERVTGRVLVALAVWIGCVRLIDNLVVEEHDGRVTSLL